MRLPSSVYQQVEATAEDFFGPMTERVLVRLINNHLGKQPEALVLADLPALTDWIMRAACMLSDENAELERLRAELLDLRS